MKKNVASQTIGAQMVSASDGSPFTGTVTVYVTGDNGTQSLGTVGSGVCTHKGNGYHSYLPAQAETNYDHIAFTFIGTGAVTVSVQIYTDFPQTGDSFARIGAPAGASVSADVAAVKAVLPAALVSGRIDASVGAMAANVMTAAAAASDLATELQSGLATASALSTVSGYLDTEVAAIKSVTDKLDTSMELDGAVYRFTTNALEQGPGGGSIPTASQIADEVQTRTIAGVTEVTRLASQERNDIADAWLDRSNAIETGLTPRGAMRLGASSDSGNVIVAGSSVTVKNFGNTKNRIQATGDELGNRTVTSTDVT